MIRKIDIDYIILLFWCSSTRSLRLASLLYHYCHTSLHSLAMERSLELLELLQPLFLHLVWVTSPFLSFPEFCIYSAVIYVVFAVLNLAFALSVMGFLIMHISLVAANTTTIEVFHIFLYS